REQRSPDPAMAMGFLDEEILEPESLLAEPRRVGREEEREPDERALVLRQEALEGRSRVRELRPDHLGGREHGIGLALVRGQRGDQPVHRRGVVGRGGADGRRHGPDRAPAPSRDPPRPRIDLRPVVRVPRAAGTVAMNGVGSTARALRDGLGRDALDDLVARGFTRRHVLRVAALLGASATLPLGSERALAQLSNTGPLPDDAVKINANEFPEGPSERALAALAEAARRGNRYQYAEAEGLVEAAAALEGLKPEHFAVYPGSSLALHHAVIAFTSPERALVVAEPG